MSRESFVFIIGIIIFLTPFLGFPREYRDGVVIAAGVLLMVVGYSLRRAAFLRSISDEHGERRADAFTESVSVRHSTERNHQPEPGERMME
jgi:hypothetical protein